MPRILYPTPVQLFQGMWASGIRLNCNVYWNCTTGCRYCYVKLNRAAYSQYYRDERDDDCYAGAAAFGRLLERVHGPKYDDADARQFFLHEKAPMCISNNSDPLCALEVEQGMTRQYLELLAEVDHPIQILTKAEAWSQLDQDAYLALFKRFSKLWVSVTITSDSEEHTRAWEPNAPTPAERFRFVRQLTDAGIPVAVHCVPFVPQSSFTRGAWEDPATYAPFFDMAKDAGAYGVMLGMLGFDAGKRKGLPPDVATYIRDTAWCQSELDKPWRAFCVDPEIELTIAQTWKQLAAERGLRFGGHQTFTSLLNDDGCLDGLGVPPAWVDRSGSWVELALKMRQKQEELGQPLVFTTRRVAQLLAENIPWRDHEFTWASWRDCVPHLWRDSEFNLAMVTMPDTVRAEDVLHFQLQQLCHWSDSLWTDLATAPIATSAGEQAGDENGDLYLGYDVHSPRESWAACRSDHGWDGRPLEHFGWQEV